MPMPTPRRRRTLKPDREGSEMRFWEFPLGFEIEAPDSATQELEELATLAAGANWGMEFADTAMHFRFRLKGDARKFLKACKYPFFPFFIPSFRHYVPR
jgi:hypothetical protein